MQKFYRITVSRRRQYRRNSPTPTCFSLWTGHLKLLKWTASTPPRECGPGKFSPNRHSAWT